uniref:Uncharacterized protein n=1 Tax=Parascaris univalens TaxID=6257 RepID=A0A915AC31_PARUN
MAVGVNGQNGRIARIIALMDTNPGRDSVQTQHLQMVVRRVLAPTLNFYLVAIRHFA